MVSSVQTPVGWAVRLRSGGKWGGMYQQDRTDKAHNLPEMCVSLFYASHSHSIADSTRLFHTTPQPTTLKVMHQYAPHLLFVPSPDGTFDNTSGQFVHKPNTFDSDRIVVLVGWDSW